MDLGKAQIAYDNMEPDYKDMSERVAELTEMYEKNILNAVLFKSKYECKSTDGLSIKLNPFTEINDWLLADGFKEALDELIFESCTKKDYQDVGKKFAELIEKIIKKMATSEAEDHATSEEMGK